jgi:hypothetical protein
MSLFVVDTGLRSGSAQRRVEIEDATQNLLPTRQSDEN